MEVDLADDGGWNCVVRFYAAVHLINAYLIDKTRLRFDPIATEHSERKKAMDQCPELRDAPKRYRQLKDLSESIRYDAGFQFSEAHREFARAHLERIAAIVEPKLKRR